MRRSPRTIRMVCSIAGCIRISRSGRTKATSAMTIGSGCICSVRRKRYARNCADLPGPTAGRGFHGQHHARPRRARRTGWRGRTAVAGRAAGRGPDGEAAPGGEQPVDGAEVIQGAGRCARIDAPAACRRQIGRKRSTRVRAGGFASSCSAGFAATQASEGRRETRRWKRKGY